ncbi:unnamed protein product [Urochloa humidicola]
MFSLSSTLAFKGLIKPSTTTIVLIVVFILTLNINSCEARHLRVHGKDSSSNLPSSPPKGADASMGDEAVTESKKKEVASSGGVARNARNVVRVLQQLRHRWHESDQEIHLDYAQPRTHTPHHN